MKWQRGFVNVTMGEYDEAEIPELVVNCFSYELFKSKVKKYVCLYKHKKLAVFKNTSA